jgi:hypothetical protein
MPTLTNQNVAASGITLHTSGSDLGGPRITPGTPSANSVVTGDATPDARGRRRFHSRLSAALRCSSG